MLEIIFPDGSKEEIESGSPVVDLLSRLPQKIRKKAVAVMIGDGLLDLRQTIEAGGEFRVLTVDDEEALHVVRHSASHLMALAVQELYRDVKFAIGPSVSDGFYYDFLLEDTFTPESLEMIEKKMSDLIAGGGLEFERKILSRAEAL
ncbi:MAG TPA: hypothetical protein VLA34_04920, partial [Candidatus Krumholzibacterium sp.]|nr:hypothetical protein [Candidatus Krumholzibacterium sp.]